MSKQSTGRDIVVIGASAGGLEALLGLIRALPEDLPASLFVVVHMAADSPSTLPGLLERAGPFRSRWPEDGEAILHGTIYVAPPDHHLIVKLGIVEAARGPQENGFRPAADPLFRTAAMAYGPRVVGVVLSGGMDDGTYGLMMIKKQGGVAIAQDPKEALFPSMPSNAIQKAQVDHVLKVRGMARVIDRLAREPLAAGVDDVAHRNKTPVDVAETGIAALEAKNMTGPPSAFTCPDCGGALWELRNGELTHYRCHVGHSFTEKALLTRQADGMDAALWTALRALEEYAEMRRRMAQRAEIANYPPMLERFARQAEEAENKATIIRNLLTGPDSLSQTDLDETTSAKSRGRKSNGRKGKGARSRTRGRRRVGKSD